MASKTLILKPTVINTSNESNISFYPSNTSINNAHLLVNEEIPDDDSTYIIISPGGILEYYFEYIKPVDCLSITNIEVCFRSCPEVKGANSMSNSLTHSVYINDTKYSFGGHTFGTNEVAYYDYAISEVSNGTNVVSFLNTLSNNYTFYVEQALGTGTKNNPVRTTQIYIKITYDYDESIIPPEPDIPEISEFLYLKNNDIWEEISLLEIYKKQNNTWKLSNISELKDGNKYILKEI